MRSIFYGKCQFILSFQAFTLLQVRSQIWDVDLHLQVTGARNIETPQWPHLQVLKCPYSCMDLLCDTDAFILYKLTFHCGFSVQLQQTDWSFLTAALQQGHSTSRCVTFQFIVVIFKKFLGTCKVAVLMLYPWCREILLQWFEDACLVHIQ